MDVLVIEEISMVSGEYFNELEKQVRTIREYQQRHQRPWGGLQIIVVGVTISLSLSFSFSSPHL